MRDLFCTLLTGLLVYLNFELSVGDITTIFDFVSYVCSRLEDYIRRGRRG